MHSFATNGQNRVSGTRDGLAEMDDRQ